MFVVNSLGKDIALHNGFKYFCRYRNKTSADNWACTQMGSPRLCKARLSVTKDRKLLAAIGEHNHVPTSFIIRNGVIIKI